MNKRGFASVVVLTGVLIAGAAAPAAAADGPLITSTGFTDGQLVGVYTPLAPVVSDDAVRIQVLLDGESRMTRTLPLLSDRLSLRPEDHGREANLTVRAFDAAGAFEDAATRVLVDIKPVQLKITPESYEIVHGPTDIVVTPDSEDLAELVMTENDGTVIERLTEAPWVFHQDFTGHSGIVRFTARDKAGNKSNPYSRGYRVDDAGPAVTLDGSIYRRPGSGFLSVDYEDMSGVTRTEWWIDGALRGTGYGGVRYDFGTKIRTVPVEVRAWDRWGNATVRKIGIRLDGTNPVVTRVSPGHLALVRGTRLTTSVTATDAGGIEDTYFAGYLGGDSGITRTGDTFTASTKLGRDGEEYVTWTVNDNAGNQTWYSRTVIVDNTLPKITKVTAPASNAKVPATVKTTVAATDKNGITRVELRVNGKLVLSDAKAPYNLNLNATRYGRSFTVAFYAIDRAGNIVSTSRRIWKR